MAGNPQQLRQRIAQLAARMVAEEGMPDYATAKRKAARQLAAGDDRCLPTNAEISRELRLYHELYRSAEQPQHVRRLRSEALEVMRLLERFHPHLAGAVLEGTAGRYAPTDIHLFADSPKDVELFLLREHIAYRVEEKSCHLGGERRRLPVFVLEGETGDILLSVFDADDLRVQCKSPLGDGVLERAPVEAVQALV